MLYEVSSIKPVPYGLAESLKMWLKDIFQVSFYALLKFNSIPVWRFQLENRTIQFSGKHFMTWTATFKPKRTSFHFPLGGFWTAGKNLCGNWPSVTSNIKTLWIVLTMWPAFVSLTSVLENVCSLEGLKCFRTRTKWIFNDPLFSAFVLIRNSSKPNVKWSSLSTTRSAETARMQYSTNLLFYTSCTPSSQLQCICPSALLMLWCLEQHS